MHINIIKANRTESKKNISEGYVSIYKKDIEVILREKKFMILIIYE